MKSQNTSRQHYLIYLMSVFLTATCVCGISAVFLIHDLKRRENVRNLTGALRMARKGRIKNKKSSCFCLPENVQTKLYKSRVHSVKGTNVRHIERFLTKEECQKLILLAENDGVNGLKRSKVTNTNRSGKGAFSYVSNDRTSSSVVLYFKKYKLELGMIRQRISLYFDVEEERIEELQVVKYESGQKFGPHVDHFKIGPDYSLETAMDIAKRGGQRTHTMFVYLNDSDGCTRFPKIDLKFEPREGYAIVFSAFDPKTGRLNPLVEHEGCPPSPKGSPKYGLNVWILENKKKC